MGEGEGEIEVVEEYVGVEMQAGVEVGEEVQVYLQDQVGLT